VVYNPHAGPGGGPVYLLVWEREPDGTWWGRVAWIRYTGAGWRGCIARVIGADLRPIPRQNYSHVPRRQVDGPRDPYDPRDPFHDKRRRTQHLPDDDEPF
jgi:hypothetical protein